MSYFLNFLKKNTKDSHNFEVGATILPLIQNTEIVYYNNLQNKWISKIYLDRS